MPRRNVPRLTPRAPWGIRPAGRWRRAAAICVLILASLPLFSVPLQSLEPPQVRNGTFAVDLWFLGQEPSDIQRGQTLQVLPAILDGLRARGLRTVTISELLGDRFTRSAHA